MKSFKRLYSKISRLETIFLGWEEFRKEKTKKKDVLQFERHLEDNLFDLHRLLLKRRYKPGDYHGFWIKDPKLRLIHKANIVDRIVHHIVSTELERIYEPTFYAHSYSCRKNKGTHKGVIALHKMAMKVSRNNTKTCWALKCDIRKYFASINHKILLSILERKIKDKSYLNLLRLIIDSFHSDRTVDVSNKKGVPIGNLTSQHFANIYLNELDQFMKHNLKVKYYIRYADDFIMLSDSLEYLERLIQPLKEFLNKQLDLELYDEKIIFRKFSSGIDFLGYVVFPHHTLPRTKTKRRLIRIIRSRIKDFKEGKISKETLNQVIQSYLGYLKHANSYKFTQELKNKIWFWLTS